jgi:hypothetical protein
MLRRTLIRWLAAFGVVPWRALPGAAVAEPELSEAETLTLRALGAAVLPRSLGRDKTDQIVGRFHAWRHGYRPGADRGHGYGVTRPNRAPPTPGASYAGQLAALEKAARANGATSFDQLETGDQRGLLDAALQAARVERLPDRPDGRHVASDLMAFFYRSTEANDLCYRAEIGKDTCRGLGDSPERPRTIGDDASRGGLTRAATAAPRDDAGS